MLHIGTLKVLPKHIVIVISIWIGTIAANIFSSSSFLKWIIMMCKECGSRTPPHTSPLHSNSYHQCWGKYFETLFSYEIWTTCSMYMCYFVTYSVMLEYCILNTLNTFTLIWGILNAFHDEKHILTNCWELHHQLGIVQQIRDKTQGTHLHCFREKSQKEFEIFQLKFNVRVTGFISLILESSCILMLRSTCPRKSEFLNSD